MTKDRFKKSEKSVGFCGGRSATEIVIILIYHILVYCLMGGLLIAFWYIFTPIIPHGHAPYFTVLTGQPYLQIPGLSVIPRGNVEEAAASITVDKKSSDGLSKEVSKFLKEYDAAADFYNFTTGACNTERVNQSCSIILAGSDLGPCSRTQDASFGFTSFTPCLLVKINKVYGWIPSLEVNDNYINVTCDRKTNLYGNIYKGKCKGIEIYPTGGYPKTCFPYCGKDKVYKPPFVMVRLVECDNCANVGIECIAHARNIGGYGHDHKLRYDRIGSINFVINVCSKR